VPEFLFLALQDEEKNGLQIVKQALKIPFVIYTLTFVSDTLTLVYVYIDACIMIRWPLYMYALLLVS
jgi:hypothetical protein